MKSEVWLYAAAGYNVALALFHVGFWRMFRWQDELPKLHPVNRGVMQVLNLMLMFVLVLLSALLVLNAAEIPASRLGRSLLAGMVLLWIVRAALQFPFWRSQPASTNGALTMLFLAGAGLHALAFPAE